LGGGVKKCFQHIKIFSEYKKRGQQKFFSHTITYIKKRSKLFFFDFPNDRPCQLIIFPIENSLHEFFVSNFSGARIFFSVSPARFLFFAFAPPPPHHFSNGPPLKAGT
jgi:hypothetical protein